MTPAVNFFFLTLIIFFIIIITIFVISPRPKKLTLHNLRGALRVAKADKKDPTQGIYWADVLATQCGLKNMIRTDIAEQKPAMETTISSSLSSAENIREEATDKANLIREKAKKFADWLRKWAELREETAAAKAANKIAAGEAAALAHEATASWAKDELVEIEEIEAIITTQMA